MFELFGLYAEIVTVRQLIFMKSGLQDFEHGTFDADMLNDGYRVHSPLEIF